MTNWEFYKRLQGQTIPSVGTYSGPVGIRWLRETGTYQLHHLFNSGIVWTGLTQEKVLELGFMLTPDPTEQELAAIRQSLQQMIKEIS
jgi:hypothetical protein